MPVISNFGVPVEGNDATTLMPKLQYRFRVSFENMGDGKQVKELTQNVISVSRPNLTHEEIVVDSYNSKTYLAGKHTWDPVTITFRDDMNSHVVKAIGNQLQKQVDHGDQASATAGGGYKFVVNIETLDGQNGGTKPVAFDTWKLLGCYISNVQYGELNYGTSDMVQVTLQLRYDHAEHNMLGQGNALSGTLGPSTAGPGANNGSNTD